MVRLQMPVETGRVQVLPPSRERVTGCRDPDRRRQSRSTPRRGAARRPAESPSSRKERRRPWGSWNTFGAGATPPCTRGQERDHPCAQAPLWEQSGYLRPASSVHGDDRTGDLVGARLAVRGCTRHYRRRGPDSAPVTRPAGAGSEGLLNWASAAGRAPVQRVHTANPPPRRAVTAGHPGTILAHPGTTKRFRKRRRRRVWLTRAAGHGIVHTVQQWTVCVASAKSSLLCI